MKSSRQGISRHIPDDGWFARSPTALAALHAILQVDWMVRGTIITYSVPIIGV